MLKEESEKEEFFYESRYPYESQLNVKETKIREIIESYAKTGKKNIERLNKNDYENMDYFRKILLDNEGRVKELIDFKKNGGKIIGFFCIQIPEELIYAAGAIPIRIECGFYDTIGPAEELIPKNTCPLIKSSCGFNFLKANPFFELIDVVIIPTTCDGKKKMADVISNYKQVWTVNLPQERESEDEQKFWLKQVNSIKEKLEKLTNNKITKKLLKKSIILLHKRTELTRLLAKIRANKIITLSGRDFYLVIQCAFFDDILRWMENVKKLIDELNKNISEGKSIAEENCPRIIMTGSPLMWPNMKLLHIIEESGGIVIADNFCSGGEYFYNPVELDEWSMSAMIQAIADKHLLPIFCPIFIHSDERVDRLLELIKNYKADGVVYHVLRLCQLFDFEFIKISKVLEKEKIPLIKIETEYSEEDSGQIKTRVEAFIEMMEARKW